MKYTLFLISAITLLCSCENPKIPQPKSETSITLQRACHYLWANQAPDGGWHSATTGIMRGGSSLSPFIFWALLNVPDSIYLINPKQKKLGLQFIRQHISNEGISISDDPEIMDYPNYASAYSAMILHRFGNNNSDKIRVNTIINYLKNQQFTEQRGIDSTHLAYGAWGFGETALEKGEIGHVDISHTRRILKCLALCGETNTDIFQKAQNYLLLAQKNPLKKQFKPNLINTDKPLYDGGFYYSTTSTGSNKGGQDAEGRYKSYATATCDGLLGLMTIDNAHKAPINDAIHWLETHPNIHVSEGIDAKNPNNWEHALVFYHLAVRAEAYRALNKNGNWEKEIADAIKIKQYPDGHFMNPAGSINKENDPLLATTLAIIGLINCLK
jgi:hypothetical protein